MRLNAIMAVMTVAVVVGVVSAPTIGPLGRLRHGGHGTFIHNRRGVSSEAADDLLAALAEPPPTPFSPPHKPPARLVVFQPLPGIPDTPFEEPQNAFTGVVMPTMTLANNTLRTEAPPSDPLPLTNPPMAAFQAAAAVPVPEPGAWAMMVLGFSAIAIALRRRRRSAGDALPLEQGRAQ
jgi:hypothetical protein